MYSSSPIIHLCPIGGIRINPINTYERRSKTLPEGCPEWATPYQQEKWRQRGVVIWEEATYSLEHTWAMYVLRAFEVMRATDIWRSEGVRIQTNAFRIRIDEAVHPPKTKRKKKQEEPSEAVVPVENQDSKSEPVLLYVSPAMSQELFTLVQIMVVLNLKK